MDIFHFLAAICCGVILTYISVKKHFHQVYSAAYGCGQRVLNQTYHHHCGQNPWWTPEQIRRQQHFTRYLKYLLIVPTYYVPHSHKRCLKTPWSCSGGSWWPTPDKDTAMLFLWVITRLYIVHYHSVLTRISHVKSYTSTISIFQYQYFAARLT